MESESIKGWGTMGSLYIRRCPFCGSECEVRSRTIGDSYVDYYTVHCLKNDHSLDHLSDSKEEAVDVWNQRVRWDDQTECGNCDKEVEQFISMGKVCPHCYVEQ